MYVSRLKRERCVKQIEIFSNIESITEHIGNSRLESNRSDEKCWKICMEATLSFYIYE